MERNISVWLPLMCPALGTRPATEACDSPQDWESNQQPFGSQAHAQSTELHQPGPDLAISDLGQKSTKRCQVGFQLCLVSGEKSGLGCRLGYHWCEMTSRALGLNNISTERVYVKGYKFQAWSPPTLRSLEKQRKWTTVREEGI